jgi:hypothetical protein
MVDIFRRLARSSAVFLLSAAACLASGPSYATCVPPTVWSSTHTYNMGDVVTPDGATFFQSLVNGNTGNNPASSPSQWNGNNILVCKVTVQPIDVCSSAGTGCPAINSLGQTAVTNPGTNQIGDIDPATGLNADVAAFAQIGISLAFRPVILYKSIGNKFTSNPITEPDFRWLHVQTCSTCATGTTSNDLALLTQQSGLSQGAKPTSPLNIDPTVPNLFFVKVIHPNTTNTIIKGFSWDANNGGAIASDSVFGGSGSSIGTVAHELGHMHGWEHATLGAGGGGGSLNCPASYPDPRSECTENLMTAGSANGIAARQLPNGALNNASINCPGAGLGQACWVPQTPPTNTTPPLALDLLTTGGVGFPTCTTANPSGCQSQQAFAFLSNFLYPIPSTITMATGGDATFDVSGLTNGSPGETLLAWILTLPQGFTFDPKNKFKILSQSRRNLLQDVDFSPPALDSDVPYPACDTARCIEVEFNRNKGQGFGKNDFMKFSQGILNGSNQPVSLGDLCGAQVTLIYSDGYTPTSTLGSSDCGSSPSSLMASSLAQDPTVPAQVSAVPTPLVISTAPPCTPASNGQCTNPVTTTGVTDSNPATGMEGGLLCTAGGVPIQCP